MIDGVGRLRKISPLVLYDNYLMISDDCSTFKRLGPSKHQRIPSGVSTHSYNAFLSHGVASSRACNNQIAELDWSVGVFHSTWRLFFSPFFSNSGSSWSWRFDDTHLRRWYDILTSFLPSGMFIFIFCLWYFPGGGFYGACCLAMIAYYGYLLASLSCYAIM